jgi:hypothetical protein
MGTGVPLALIKLDTDHANRINENKKTGNDKRILNGEGKTDLKPRSPSTLMAITTKR